VSRKRLAALITAACALCLARPAAAQAVKTPRPAAVFRSGLPVPSVHPGEAARSFVREIRKGAGKKGAPDPVAQALEDRMPLLLSSIEAQMEAHGFARRDVGVAMGMFFVGNWQAATHTKLTDPAVAAAIRTVASAAASHWKPRYSALNPAEKEQVYETLLIGTALADLPADKPDKAGDEPQAAILFRQMIGVPPLQVKIAPDGRISGLAPDFNPTAGLKPLAAPKGK